MATMSQFPALSFPRRVLGINLDARSLFITAGLEAGCYILRIRFLNPTIWRSRGPLIGVSRSDYVVESGDVTTATLLLIEGPPSAVEG